MAWVLLTLVLCALLVTSVCNISFVELLMLLLGVLGGCAARVHQRLSVALHGTLGSYLRDALHEGIADAVACLPVPRA
jgi:hypothetical protein